MITLIIFILVLGLLVFVHELGHFLVAKRNGVYSHEFGFGFPPRIFGFRKINGKYKFFFGHKDVESEDTIYSINLIPLGGFVKIKGQDGENSSEANSFSSKSAWPKFKILFAGVLMNFILGYIFLTVGFISGMPVALDPTENADNYKDVKVQILSVATDTPAIASGLETGDVISKINDKKVSIESDVQNFISESNGNKLMVEIVRGTEILNKEITPIKKDDKFIIGISMVRTGLKDYPWYEALWQGLVATLFMITQIFIGFFVLIKNIIFTQSVGMDVAGPVGIAVMTGKAAQQGIFYLMNFIAILSINLGVINLLPFPALDGGRILFLIIEKIRRKPVSQNVEGVMHMIGFALLILLMLFVTFKDVTRWL